MTETPFPGPIPKIIHQAWVGPNPIPPHCAELVRMVRDMHPHWQHKLHGNELLDRYAHDPLLRVQLATGARWAFVADRLRVLLLFDEGGAWLDCDCEPIRPLDGVLDAFDSPEFIIGQMPHEKKTEVSVLFSAPHSMPAEMLLREMNNPHRAGCQMVLLTADSPGISYAPPEWFYARRREDAVYVYHEGHRLRSWHPRGMVHDWALIVGDRDGIPHMTETSPNKAEMLRALAEVDTGKFPFAGVFWISAAKASRYRRQP